MKFLAVPLQTVQENPEVWRQVREKAVFVMDIQLRDAAELPIVYTNMEVATYYIPAEYRLATWLMMSIPELKIIDIDLK